MLNLKVMLKKHYLIFPVASVNLFQIVIVKAAEKYQKENNLFSLIKEQLEKWLFVM